MIKTVLKHPLFIPVLAVVMAVSMWGVAALIFFEEPRRTHVSPTDQKLIAKLALPGIGQPQAPPESTPATSAEPEISGEIPTPAAGPSLPVVPTAPEAETEVASVRTIDPEAVMAALDKAAGVPPQAAPTTQNQPAAAAKPDPAAKIPPPPAAAIPDASLAQVDGRTEPPAPAMQPTQPATSPASSPRAEPSPGQIKTGVAPDGNIVLGWPIKCRVGDDCYVQQYVDHDSTDGYKDYRCGPLSYDTHKGTDIRLPSIPAMDKGVEVVAALAGVVSAIREGMPDVHMRLVGREAVNDRGLGNVVVLDHPGGWRTVYAHMHRDSLRVKKGDKVEAGQVLGLVGMSGLTEFPHLHFGVMRNGNNVDPFIGDVPMEGCDMKGKPLWAPEVLAQLPYRKTFVTASGFYNRELKREALLYGLADEKTLPRNIDDLYFFVDISGAYAGDALTVQFLGPGDRSLSTGSGTIKEQSAVNFQSFRLSRKSKDTPWQTGTYRAVFQLFRTEKGERKEVLKVERSIELQ
ncbi:MAG: peptidoglycan DD-metalloendopeptidase family protein [Alphaproteobacteria bacterium]